MTFYTENPQDLKIKIKIKILQINLENEQDKRLIYKTNYNFKY